MYRIRYHGRGGQGMKTAGRILGSAFFLAGYEVQDAPRYGAERRGAPIFSYVRAAKNTIHERGVIDHPDLTIVADDTLVAIPAAGCLQGLTERSVLLINSKEAAEVWRERLNFKGKLLVFPIDVAVDDRAEMPFVGAGCTGAAARLLGVISKEQLQEAINLELAEAGTAVRQRNIAMALAGFDAMAEFTGSVKPESDTLPDADPDWIDLPLEPAKVSAPVIHAGLTSVQVKTGLWRTLRPVIDLQRCNKCWWVCSTFCPDSAINVENDIPVIDYDHCKGCMVCVAQCPPHAIEGIPEAEATHEDGSAGEHHA